jgi:tetraacyldisaccharide 4'-kinase
MNYARLLLIPFSFFYWVVIAARNRFFDIGILKTTKSDVPVISVGNISAGGTGKTPIVEILIEKLKKNRQLSVVSRGYRRKSSGTIVANDGKGNCSSVEKSGDEPGQLAAKYRNLIVVANEKRICGAKKAVELGAKIVILDDGFQHRYLHRDLNIVVITVDEILKGDCFLPAGNRREPISSLKRSDLIIVSRCLDENEFYKAAEEVRSFNKPILGVRTKLKSLRRVSTNAAVTDDYFTNKKVIAVSGIGNPNSFESLLSDTGVKIEKHLIFSDHHWYSKKDIKKIIETKKLLNADIIITTEKDVTRIGKSFDEYLTSENLIVAEIRQEIIAGEQKLDELLKQLVG